MQETRQQPVHTRVFDDLPGIHRHYALKASGYDAKVVEHGHALALAEF